MANISYRQIEEYLKSKGIEIKNVSAYGWGDTNIEKVKFNKNDYCSGWWNECYNFGMFYTQVKSGIKDIDRIASLFKGKPYYKAETLYNPFGYACIISYCEMTKEESDRKALANLMSGGRMSD